MEQGGNEVRQKLFAIQSLEARVKLGKATQEQHAQLAALKSSLSGVGAVQTQPGGYAHSPDSDASRAQRLNISTRLNNKPGAVTSINKAS